MRKILIFAVALFVCSSVSAQKIEDFKARLAEPVLNDSLGMVGKVVVHEVGTAAEVVRKSDATKRSRVSRVSALSSSLTTAVRLAQRPRRRL